MNGWRKWLGTIIMVFMAIEFVYGMVRFFDGPLHECATGFCGKQGQPHTAAEYHAYMIWQTVMLITWPLGMLTLLLLGRFIRRE